jgi:hypothetical protein
MAIASALTLCENQLVPRLRAGRGA